MVLTDQNPFYYAAAGGLILGLATSLNYCLKGKVTGMSGMVHTIFFWQKDDLPSKLTLIGGMLLASGIFFDIFQYGSYNKFSPFGPQDQITTGTSYIGYALAGLLVGFGTKLGNGCTSGHGLCGIARLSKRSFAAVIIFLVTALAISTLRYHVTLGPFTSQNLNPQLHYHHLASANVCIAVGAILPFLGFYLTFSAQENTKTKCQVFVDQLVSFATGFIFGVGLLVAGMVRRVNILGFLGLGQNWNPSLMFVLGCGVLVNLVTFSYMIKCRKTPYLGTQLFNPKGADIDWKLVLGASCFGLGWGIAGLCPGPAIMQLAVFTVPIHVIWFGCLLIGMLIAKKLDACTKNEQTPQKKQNPVESSNIKMLASQDKKHSSTSSSSEDKKDENKEVLPTIQTNQVLPNEINLTSNSNKKISISSDEQTHSKPSEPISPVRIRSVSPSKLEVIKEKEEPMALEQIQLKNSSHKMYESKEQSQTQNFDELKFKTNYMKDFIPNTSEK